MNKDNLLEIAKATVIRLSKEKELLVAKFITENPSIKAEDILLTQVTIPNGYEITVGRKYEKSTKID